MRARRTFAAAFAWALSNIALAEEDLSADPLHDDELILIETEERRDIKIADV